MKFPAIKDLLLPGLLVLAIVIVFCIGLNERTHPDEYVIDFPTVLAQPDDITCGPTSVTMILHYYGKTVTLDEVKIHTKTVWFTHHTHDVGMTSPDYLAVAMQHFGVPASMKYGNIDTLKHTVAQGIPVIALVRSDEKLWHYIVIHGFTQDKVLVADPGGGSRYDMEIAKFIGCWSWTTDMDGTVCENNILPTLLRAAEIYPYTYICPDNPKE